MDEFEIIQRCRGGDKAAFEALFQQYAQKALRTAFLISHQQSLAEDAVQETFVQVWRSIHELRETNAFRGWFFRILINQVRRLVRRDSRNPILPLETAAEHRDQYTIEPEDQVERNEELYQIQSAIALLPEQHRLTLILRYYSGLSVTEIGETLSIPTGTVKSRLHAAREQLQKQLAEIERGNRRSTLNEKQNFQGNRRNADGY